MTSAYLSFGIYGVHLFFIISGFLAVKSLNINKKDKPLALYYFSENSKKIEYVINNTTAGGVTINDTIIHVANGNLPFGGVGTSGLGKYHGKESFECFSHNKSVMKRGTFIEFKVRFAPYNNRIKLLKKIMN